jgi:hypothetical protein
MEIKFPIFTDQQLADISKMEACCNRIEGHIASLEALGLDMKDERIQNDFARACCERLREIQQAAAKQGM